MVDLGWVKVKMEVVDLRSVGSLEEMRHLLDAQLRGVCAHEPAAPRAACVDEAFARVRGLVEGLCGSDLGRGHAARLEAVSDVRGHLGRLEALAADARSVLECGVRHGVASWALAHGLARSWRRNGRRRLVRNDVAADVGAEPRFLAAVAAAGVRVEEHWSVSDLHLDVGAVDVVFIDTLHTYGQLRRELEKFGATTRSYIAIHDTEVDGQRGEAVRLGMDLDALADATGIPAREHALGLQQAIDEFVAEGSWRVAEHHAHCNGLTILQRRRRSGAAPASLVESRTPAPRCPAAVCASSSSSSSSKPELYFINLARRADRLRHMASQLEGLEEHLSIERWEALDADTASFDTADLLKFAPLDLVRHPLPPTAAPDISVTALRAIIANQLGHSRIWERVAPSDDELFPPGRTYGGGDDGDEFEARRFDLLSQYAVIVQDDVRLAPDFAAGLEALAADLPHDAEVVWLGHDLCMHPLPPAVQFAARVTEHVGRCLRCAPCSSAYLLTRAGAAHLLEHVRATGFERATDMFMEDFLKERRRNYVATPPLVTLDRSFGSDVARFVRQPPSP